MVGREQGTHQYNADRGVEEPIVEGVGIEADETPK
jgi:hypothetical protein